MGVCIILLKFYFVSEYSGIFAVNCNLILLLPPLCKLIVLNWLFALERIKGTFLNSVHADQEHITALQSVSTVNSSKQTSTTTLNISI